MLDEVEIEQEYFDEENQSDFTVVDFYLNKIKKFNILKRSEEIALFERYKKGDEDARKEIINKNLRLVVSIAKKYVRSDVKIEDLISEGNIGLMECMEKYNAEISKFSTYATWHIKKYVMGFIGDHGRTVRVPRNLNTEIRKAIREGVDKNKILKYGQPTLSMHHFITETTTIQDVLVDEKELVEDQSMRLCLESNLHKAIKKLSNRERYVILNHFGFNCEEKTLECIGQNFNITRERTRQIKVDSIDKIRKSLKRKGMNKEDFL